MTIISNLARRSTVRRQLHTIVSRETIKPSFSSPCHLKTHNLSLLDQLSVNSFMPIVTFYPNNPSIHRTSHEKTLDMKKSLSQTLTSYNPFARRLEKITPAQVDCSDDGAEPLIPRSRISCKNYKHEDLDHLFPYGRVWYNSKHGGQTHSKQQVIPLAVSLSHKIADGSSLACFLYDWSSMTRVEHSDLPTNPNFMSFPFISINFDRFVLKESDDCVSKSFMFPNTKLNNLKLKVTSMTSIANPTRVEVLNWLLYKYAVAATTKNSFGFSKLPIGVSHVINMRHKMMEPLPKNTIGKFCRLMKIFTHEESDLKPEAFINELKQQKMGVKSLRNVESAIGLVSSETHFEEEKRFIDGGYICSSLCGYPLYEIDFGWGKPVKVTIAGNMMKDCFIFTDTPNRDGIEALVCLGREEMAINQTEPELLACF